MFWVEISKLGILKYILESKELRIAKIFSKKKEDMKEGEENKKENESYIPSDIRPSCEAKVVKSVVSAQGQTTGWMNLILSPDT